MKTVNHLMIAFSFLLISFGIDIELEAQDSTKSRVNIRGSYHTGFLLPHRVSMQHIPQNWTNGFEIRLEKEGTNTEDWEKLYNNPTVGVSFMLSDVGNYDILGNAMALHAYMLIPIVKAQKFHLQTSWGWGLGYLTKHFDPIENNQNVAIGSGLNLFAGIQLVGDFFISKRDAISLGAAYNHWSNSGIQFPNLGINVPTVTLGYVHKFHDQREFTKLSREDKKAFVPKEKNEFVILPSVGFRALNINDNSVFPAYCVSLQYARLWSQKWKVSGAIDLQYNQALAKDLENKQSDSTAFQTGASVLYHQTIGGFSIIVGMGAYLFDQTFIDEAFYHRFGTRFLVSKNLVVTTNLYTHWARADRLEIGLGYKIRR